MTFSVLRQTGRAPSGACTSAGLVRFDGSRERVFRAADGLPEDRVRATCETPDGTRWVAGIDFGLSRSGGEFVYSF